MIPHKHISTCFEPEWDKTGWLDTLGGFVDNDSVKEFVGDRVEYIIAAHA